MITDWIYMCEDNSFDTIVEALEEYDVEVWKELGVIEINKDGGSVDFELIPEKRWDDYCREVISDLHLSCMYQVSVSKDAVKWSESMMHRICSIAGGKFFADTEDLSPVVG